MKSLVMKTCSVAFLLLCSGVLFTSCSRSLEASTTMPENTPSEADYISVDDPLRYIKPVFENVDVENDIPYREIKNSKGSTEKLCLDIYQPSGDTNTKRPAIILMHGGSFIRGDKSEATIVKDLVNDFAKMGYVTLSINYRLRENPSNDWQGTFRDTTSDAAAAVDWLVDNSEKYRIDKDHIALGGYSAGACTAVNLIYRDGKNANWNKNSIFGVIDLSGTHFWMGKAYKNDPPCVIIHGTADTTVSFSESETNVKAFKSNDINYVLHPIEGATHNLSPYYDEVLDVTKSFLYKALTNKEAN